MGREQAALRGHHLFSNTKTPTLHCLVCSYVSRQLKFTWVSVMVLSWNNFCADPVNVSIWNAYYVTYLHDILCIIPWLVTARGISQVSLFPQCSSTRSHVLLLSPSSSSALLSVCAHELHNAKFWYLECFQLDLFHLIWENVIWWFLKRALRQNWLQQAPRCQCSVHDYI